MFPFHRKHSNNHNNHKRQGRNRYNYRNSEENEMSDEEFLEYIHQNDTSRNQLTSGAHDRYCHRIIREKEDVLLSALNTRDSIQSPDNYELGGSSTSKVFLNLMPGTTKYNESISMPTSPVQNRNILFTDNVIRRKSDTIMADVQKLSPIPNDQRNENEYILTLKVDNLASNLEDVSLFRIGPKQKCTQECSSICENVDDKEAADRQAEKNSSSCSPCSKINQNFVQYREITTDLCEGLKNLLIRSGNYGFYHQWFRQCFSFSHIAISRWQLVQVKSGSCGVIAAVEAYVIKCLLFDPGFCKFKEPLRPNQKEIVDAFVTALSYILWQSGDFEKSVLLIPKNADGKENVECTLEEMISESCAYVEYFNFDSLKEAIAINMKYFTCPPYNGYLNLIMSVMLSRGINRIKEDMDDEVTLITENGHCSLELVLLLITGRAASNVFDNDIRIDSCLLKGVKKQSDVGFLSLFEYMNTCEVGSFLKSPKFPIWLVNCADHFTVLFSNKLEHAKQDITQPFVLYHYDSMTAFSCENDVKLVIDTQPNYAEDQFKENQSHLQLCVKTKWKNATIIYTENSELYLV